MKFILVGDDFPAVQTLKLLLSTPGAVVLGIYTTPRPNGVGSLRALARAAGIPYYPSDDLKRPETLADLALIGVDWLINVNSTVLLPKATLDLPACGALNLHPGLLPEYAGLHTHQWAIRNGESTFGVTIHFMEPELAAGDIVAERRFPVAPDDTGLSLFRKCIQEGTVAMRDVLRLVFAGEPLPRRPQNPGRFRLYRHLDALDGRIDWRWPAAQVERFVRAGNYTMLTLPSYTPHLDLPTGGSDIPLIELLKVEVTDLKWPTRSGMVAASQPEEAPVITCGDGYGVRVIRARRAGDPHLLPIPELRSYLRPGTLLKGRRPFAARWNGHSTVARIEPPLRAIPAFG